MLRPRSTLVPLALLVAVSCGSKGPVQQTAVPVATNVATPAGSAAPSALAASPVTTTTPPGPSALHIEVFKTPSGNIGCAYYAPTMRCDIHQSTYKPPAQPKDCDLDWGDSIELERGGSASFVCHGDTVFDPSAKVLGYGEKTRVDSILCESSEAGIRCSDEGTSHGFELSRASYRLF